MIKKSQKHLPWTNVTRHYNGEEIVGTFYGKELQKRNQKSLELKKQ